MHPGCGIPGYHSHLSRKLPLLDGEEGSEAGLCSSWRPRPFQDVSRKGNPNRFVVRDGFVADLFGECNGMRFGTFDEQWLSILQQDDDSDQSHTSRIKLPLWLDDRRIAHLPPNQIISDFLRQADYATLGRYRIVPRCRSQSFRLPDRVPRPSSVVNLEDEVPDLDNRLMEIGRMQTNPMCHALEGLYPFL